MESAKNIFAVMAMFILIAIGFSYKEEIFAFVYFDPMVEFLVSKLSN